MEDVVRRPDRYFAYQFDGTEESVAELAEVCGPDGPQVRFVSPTQWRICNWAWRDRLDSMPIRDLDTVIVFERKPREPVVMVDEFATRAEFERHWQPAGGAPRP